MNPIDLSRSFQLHRLAHCPSCKKQLDGATGGREPRPGDFSVCAYCSAILRFEETLGILSYREISIDEVDKDKQEMVRVIVAGVNAVQKKRRQ